MKDISQIAERILGRPLSPADGEKEHIISATELKIDIQLPKVLRNFYFAMGKNRFLMAAFQKICPLNELSIENDVLIFMIENQGVALWGIRTIDLGSDDPEVYQVNPNDTAKIYSEEQTLSSFLSTILYYQAAQGGYEYVGWLYEFSSKLPDINRDWEKVVEDKGLHIWWQDGKIIFKLDGGDDDFLTTANRTETLLNEVVEKYGFDPDEST